MIDDEPINRDFHDKQQRLRETYSYNRYTGTIPAQRVELENPKIKTEKGEFVLLDGSDYQGYYHIQDDGTIMSEATYMLRKSQPLITRSDWIDNKETYLIITEKMDYKNPYRKRKLNKNRGSKQKWGKIKFGGKTGGKLGGGSGGGSSGGGGY